MLTTITNAARSLYQFATGGSGYDAVASDNRRKAISPINRSEDAELMPSDRKKMVAASRDIYRNFSLAAWMIRRHLDYVTTFNFQAKTGDSALDDSLERLMRWWQNPYNCDATSRFSLAKMIRMAEMRRVIDGDVFFLKIKDGTLQVIEGDRVRTPQGNMPANMITSDMLHGVRMDEAGRHLGYSICKRGKLSDTSGTTGTFEFERMIPARNAYHYAYIDRFDQVRGISPLSSTLNTLRDVYEGFGYALAKLKVSQLFGLVFYREASDSMGNVETSGEDGSGYEVDFGRGAAVMDLDPGDRAEFLESRSPSTEFQQFTQTMIGVALKSLDIPYSFYAENFTNYSGARQALLQYELSAKIKRQDVVALLDHLTNWRIQLWINDGVLPSDKSYRWDWIPQGVSWIDPLKEINANIAALGAGLTSRTRLLREQGVDFYDLVDEIETETKYMVSKGIPVELPPVATLQEVAAANV